MPPSADPLHLSHGLHRLSTMPNPLKRAWTPVMSDSGSVEIPEAEAEANDRNNARQARMKEHFARSERKLFALFGKDPERLETASGQQETVNGDDGSSQNDAGIAPASQHKPARTIDEDDYGDEDDDEDDTSDKESPLKGRGNAAPYVNGTIIPSKLPSASKPLPPAKPPTSAAEQAKTSEDARKKLEEEKKAAETAAKESFRTIFYTLDSDRDAMLEQQKLDELDRQVETELAGQTGNSNNASNNNAAGSQGSLSSANLGSSSLTFKHLIARIDAKRNKVKASDTQLRSLMSDVRKNRSRWASTEMIGQEELYEAAEKVLLELKSMTEYAAPFLQKVNKRDAPDYYNIIQKPMDFSQMLKRLNSHFYKSKKDFVDDLNLIWANCLKYNTDPNHVLRKKALHMRKETEKLVPLIPDIVVRDRAEVEAEERRLQQGEFDLDEAEDSDDEEPIMASRGRAAPGKKSKKGGTTSRKAPSGGEASADADSKPLSALAGPMTQIQKDLLRLDAESTAEGSQHGHSTPPPAGILTPLGVNGVGSAAPGSHADPSELDGPSMNGVLGSGEELGEEDEEYKTWKQVTKKDRAHAAAERHKLFKGDKLNPEEPALLRTKAGMRRWTRQQKPLEAENSAAGDGGAEAEGGNEQNDPSATLAEGIDGENERNLPDYYDPLSAIPQLDERLAWLEDSDGQVIDPKEEYLRMIPKGAFKPPPSLLSSRIESNMRQMQETRKIVTKIGIVKQMQLQTQTYQNQFQKYEPEPFTDPEMEPLVVSDDGPFMSQYLCRATLQKAVGKIFYHAGFEEFQPSAMEAVTDMAGDYFTKIVRTLGVYRDAPKIYESEVAEKVQEPIPVPGAAAIVAAEQPKKKLVRRFTPEEIILHALHENGTDLDSLETYVTEDVERQSSKLDVQHARMKEHLAELLRPALDPSVHGSMDTANAFNDGSDQFVGGDILAEDLDEDFFGFKELGLDKEFGLASLSVPLHLLQSRVRNAYQPANATTTSTDGLLMEELERWPALTEETLAKEIGLIQDFFKSKLEQSEEDAVIEDDELPTKARFPKPRLPPTGKITSPRKRPIREIQAEARKKRKMEKEEEKEAEKEAEKGAEGSADKESEENLSNGAGPIKASQKEVSVSASQQTPPTTSNSSSAKKSDDEAPTKSLSKPISKLKLDMPSKSSESNRDNVDPEKSADENSATGIKTPESMPIAAH